MRWQLILPLTVWLSGQAPSLSQDRITEEAFLAAVRETHLARVALATGLGAAEGRLLDARAAPDPVLVAGREETDPGAVETSLAVAWTVPLARGRRVAAAEAGLEAARRDVDAAWWVLRGELRAAFADWAIDAERAGALRELLRQAEDLARRTDEQMKAGEISGLAARRIRLAVLELRGAAALADHALLQSESRVRAYLPESSRDIQPSRPELPGLGDIAAGESAVVAAFAARIRQLEAERNLARAALFEPEIQVGWKRVEEDAGNADGPVVEVGLPLPLFRRDRGARRALQLELESVRAQADFARTRAALDAAAARTGYERLREAALEADRATRDALQSLQGATQAYLMGELTVTDLLDTLRSLHESRSGALDLYLDALEAHRRLEAATGRPLVATGEPR